MRRKIGKAIEDGGDLPDLTEQQEKFVQAFLSGKNASDAYRTAYDCSGSQKNTIWANASRLANDANVAAWIAASRKARLGSGVLTLENHLNELERLKEIALETGNVGAAVQAEQIRGKVAGHHAERVELTVHDPAVALRQITEEFGLVIAQAVASREGIEWQETQH